ncbi:hypothetical protein [uncultured Devosia sp.]|uniref:hypothetical protein n=1 Tax=uncultured Devosia sp. TaxID=211434 RepID=UPI002602E860|nr:hypothetical protein [uncultured Devosia sp.]
MTDLKENFNKISIMDDRTAVETGLKKLNDPEKLWIYRTFEHQCAQERAGKEKTLERERLDRITAFANQHTDRQALEHGTVREKRIHKEEVEAMMKRGRETKTALEEVTPASPRENLIVLGAKETSRFEKQKMKRLDETQMKDRRKLVENLMTLDNGRAYDGVTRKPDHWGKDGKSLKQEFNQSRSR